MMMMYRRMWVSRVAGIICLLALTVATPVLTERKNGYYNKNNNNICAFTRRSRHAVRSSAL